MPREPEMPRFTARRLAIAAALTAGALFFGLCVATPVEQMAEFEIENRTDVHVRVEVRSHSQRSPNVVAESLQPGGVAPVALTYLLDFPPSSSYYHVRAYDRDGVEVYRGAFPYTRRDRGCRVVLVESPPTDEPRPRADCVRPDAD